MNFESTLEYKVVKDATEFLLKEKNRNIAQSGFTTTDTPTKPATSAAAAASRKDALTKKPLDLEEEDEARKFETSKWLESHFGSDSRSSHGSLDEDFEQLHHKANASTNTSYINVTMKSARAPTRKVCTREASTSPSGYFQGISEWSERYHSTTGASSYNLFFYLFFFTFVVFFYYLLSLHAAYLSIQIDHYLSGLVCGALSVVFYLLRERNYFLLFFFSLLQTIFEIFEIILIVYYLVSYLFCLF